MNNIPMFGGAISRWGDVSATITDWSETESEPTMDQSGKALYEIVLTVQVVSNIVATYVLPIYQLQCFCTQIDRSASESST